MKTNIFPVQHIRDGRKKETVNVLPVNYCPVVTLVHLSNGYPQKKGENPDTGHH